MQINKLKKLLAEGNPDKQLDNIIENLSLLENKPAKIANKQFKLASTNDEKGDQIELEIIALTKGRDIKQLSPDELFKIKELQAELKILKNRKDNHTTDALTNLEKSRGDESGGLYEGVDKMELKTIKFGTKVEETAKPINKVEEKTNIKEENLMKKEQKAIFEQSMADIFKMLKEGDDEMTEEELMVGKVPSVESPIEEEIVEIEPGQEVIQAEEPVLEPELQANDADVAIAEPEMVEEMPVEAMEEVPAEEIMPVEVMEEVPAEEVMPVEVMPEMQAPEELKVSTSSQPTVEYTENSINITIPVSKEEGVVTHFSPEMDAAINEALRTVYRSLSRKTLSEEEVVEVPDNAEATVETKNGNLVITISTKEPMNDEITQEDADSLEEAVSVLSFLLKEELEVSKTEEQQYRVEKEIAPVDAPHPSVKTEIKSGEIVVQPHDHADAEGVEVRNAVITRENVEADVRFSKDSVRIEIPLVNGSVSEINEESTEGLQEAFNFIYSLSTSKLNEDNSVTIPDNMEAEIIVENNKLIIELPVSSPKGELSEQETIELQEAINFISFILAEGTILSEEVEYVAEESLLERPDRVITILDGGGGGSPVTEVVKNPGYLGFLGNVASGFGKPFKAIGNAIGGVGSVLGANPWIGTGLGVAGGLGAIGAGTYLLGTKAGRKYLQKKFGITKKGRAYQDLVADEQAKLNQEKAKEFQAIAGAEADFAKKDAARKTKEIIARSGSTFLNRIGSKSPLAGLGNFKIGSWRPFANQELQDKMAAKKKSIITSYTDPNSPEYQQLDAAGFKYDPKTGRVVDKTTGKLTDASIQAGSDVRSKLRRADDFSSAVSDVESEYERTKEANYAQRMADKEARDRLIDDSKTNLIAKQAEFDAKGDSFWADAEAGALNERFYFDVDAAYSILEGRDFSEEEKLDIISIAYSNLFLEDTKNLILESGFNISEKGLSLFLESKNVELSMEEKDGLMKSLNSESVKKDFEEHYQSKKHSDIKSEEMTNKDMNYGKSSTEVTPPIIQESEKAKKPHTEELNHGGSDTIDSTGKLATDKKASEKEESFTVKAEPTDVTIKEAAKYRSLKEAFLLESDYFEKDSSSVVSAGDKKNKLVSQLGLLVARDVQDPLYEELIRATAVSKRLQEELQSKYKAVALKKAGDLLSSKSKKK